MKSADLKKVIWMDSNTRSGWHYPDEQKYGPLKVTSVGWCVAECDESITLAGSVVFGDDFQASDTMTIPKVCIVSNKTLAKR